MAVRWQRHTTHTQRRCSEGSVLIAAAAGKSKPRASRCAAITTAGVGMTPDASAAEASTWPYVGRGIPAPLKGGAAASGCFVLVATTGGKSCPRAPRCAAPRCWRPRFGGMDDGCHCQVGRPDDDEDDGGAEYGRTRLWVSQWQRPVDGYAWLPV